MRNRCLLVIALLLMLIGPVTSAPAQAQTRGPLLIIHGVPDTSSAPEVRTYVSVVDRDAARSIGGLTAANFRLWEETVEISPIEVTSETAGLAVVLVVDRGEMGTAQNPKTADGRAREAAALVEETLGRLITAGNPSDDIVALVGVAEKNQFFPWIDFTYPVDLGAVRNTLVDIAGQKATGGTALYEGVAEALRLLTENPDIQVQELLSARRKVVIVFSDGIDVDYSKTDGPINVINTANEHNIAVYTVGMARYNQGLTEGGKKNLMYLAEQTGGRYLLHNNEQSHGEVLTLFDAIVTQRYQYLVRYRTSLPKGKYHLDLVVDTPIGSSPKQGADFGSQLDLPRMTLIEPTDGLQLTIPYSTTFQGYIPTALPLRVQITPVDGVARDPAEVRYFANDQHISNSVSAPDYQILWNITNLVTPTTTTETRKFTLRAEAFDPLLGESMHTENVVTVRISWAAPPPPAPPPIPERTRTWLENNYAVAIILAALTGCLIFLLIRTRGTVRERGEQVTQAVRDFTRQLTRPGQKSSDSAQRPWGRLTVLEGEEQQRKFTLSGESVVVGRRPGCRIRLHDSAVSSQHFAIFQEDFTAFFIEDLKSTNGTFLNDAPIEKAQRVPLESGTIISVGETRLQFELLGGTTGHVHDSRGGPEQEQR